MAEKNKLSPIMQQYLDMKAENPAAVLMFRLGDFYEAFFNDAKIVSKALDLVLTHRGADERGSDIPMCGIPWHAADNYFGRLVKHGISVALAEQMETPEQAKTRGHKQIDRKIIRVLTAGTLTDDNLLSPKKSNFLVAVARDEGRGIKEEGSGISSLIPHPSSFVFSGCDISTGEFFTGTAENIFDSLSRINPAEVLYPEHLAETPEMMHIRANFNTTPINEKSYNRKNIDAVIKSILNTEYSTTANKLLAVYLQNTQRGANVAFRAPYEFGAGRQLLVDSATWKSLEIDSSLNDGGLCLLDILDKTRTSAGARKLRLYLHQLSGDISEIRHRQEHIGHLLINSDIRAAMTAVLDKVPDIGRSLARLLSGRGMPRDLRAAADFITALPTIKMTGMRLDKQLADRFSEIQTHEILADELKAALADALPALFRDGGIIREGFDAGLDRMKNLAHGARETIAKLQSEYAAATGINTLKIKYNNILGYHIEVPSARADGLMAPDSGFIHRQTMTGNMRFTTARLAELDNEVRGAAEKANGMESEIVSRLIEKLRDVSDDLLKTADLLSDADVWNALATAAAECGWKRPMMTSGQEFDIRGGRHPVIESVLKKSGNQFVRNDCELNEKKCALLTGPNMAGKSTYLRQNALIVVLAHLGSFVPADSATIGIVDQLFSRVGASDNLAAGQSTFMVEMQETANILKRATARSFIIFDEIGRGTATYDGMAIAQAVLEYMNALRPRTLFATHYHELTGLQLNSVRNLNVQVKEYNNEIIFMHKIAEGAAESSYGIHVAKMAGMPASVVASAEKILTDLENGCGSAKPSTPQNPPTRKESASDAPVYILRSPEKKTKPELSLF